MWIAALWSTQDPPAIVGAARRGVHREAAVIVQLSRCRGHVVLDGVGPSTDSKPMLHRQSSSGNVDCGAPRWRHQQLMEPLVAALIVGLLSLCSYHGVEGT